MKKERSISPSSCLWMHRIGVRSALCLVPCLVRTHRVCMSTVISAKDILILRYQVTNFINTNVPLTKSLSAYYVGSRFYDGFEDFRIYESKIINKKCLILLLP